MDLEDIEKEKNNIAKLLERLYNHTYSIIYGVRLFTYFKNNPLWFNQTKDLEPLINDIFNMFIATKTTLLFNKQDNSLSYLYLFEYIEKNKIFIIDNMLDGNDEKYTELLNAVHQAKKMIEQSKKIIDFYRISRNKIYAHVDIDMNKTTVHLDTSNIPPFNNLTKYFVLLLNTLSVLLFRENIFIPYDLSEVDRMFSNLKRFTYIGII